MKQTRSSTIFTAFSMALLALGLVALLGMAFLRHPAPGKTLPQSRVPQLIATRTAPPLSQAITTPQPTTQNSQPSQPITTTAAGGGNSQPAAALPPNATVVIAQTTPLAQGTTLPAEVIEAGTVGPMPTQQESLPTPVAAGGGGNAPVDLPPDVPGTGSSSLNPVLTAPPLLPAEPTAGLPVLPTVGAANVSTPQPTAKLPQAPVSRPTSPPPTPTRVAAKATVKPKPAVPVLPNGVVYGDHKPNLPSRIVRIASPNIRLDTSVYEVYASKGVWEVADYAAGHHYNSKNPGEGGNIVMAGHNNWRGEVFRYVADLKQGNLIKIWTLDGKERHYTVQSVNKVLEAGASQAQRLKNAKAMDPTSSEQLTLITCWPYTTFTHRVIVVAKPSP